MKKLLSEDGRRVIGILNGKVFRKTVSKGVHWMRKMDAWGIDYHALYKQLPEDGWVEMYDKDEGKTYRVTVQDYKNSGMVRRFKGQSAQVFLKSNYWTVVGV